MKDGRIYCAGCGLEITGAKGFRGGLLFHVDHLPEVTVPEIKPPTGKRYLKPLENDELLLREADSLISQTNYPGMFLVAVIGD